MELKERYSEIGVNQQPNKVFRFKPTSTIAIVLVVGIMFVASIMFVDNLWIIGLVMIGLALFVQVAAKDYKILSVYEDFFVVHNPKQDTQGIQISWDDVAEWKSLNGSASDRGTGLLILLTNQEVVYVNSAQVFPIAKYFKGKIPQFEASKVQLSKIKNTPLSFFKKKEG